jgi:creatinine amidohydrolase
MKESPVRIACIFGIILGVSLTGMNAFAAEPATVMLEDMTWAEVQQAVKSSSTSVIVPIGGTEQNGPHMALGKHNARTKVLAGKIASRLGHTLVAPVMAYVPEGSITPPAGHMRFAGTLSVPAEAFGGIVEGAARSLKQHGFTEIILIGDHGGYQPQLKTIADRLNKEWSTGPARVHFIDAYYQAAQKPYADALRAKGLSDFQIGTHAGSADTSLTMALAPQMVRSELIDDAAQRGPAAGTVGDPRKSSPALGEMGAELIVTRTVEAIRAVQARR